MSSVLIELRGVYKSYSRGWIYRTTNPVLHNVSLILHPGDRLGISGPSGTGKSTLGKIITGIEPPDSGQVLWNGKNIRSHESRGYYGKLRPKVQLMVQDPVGALNPVKKVSTLLGEVCRFMGMRDNQGEKEIAIALTQVGLSSDILGMRPPQLSGGMNQRLLLARLLILRPWAVVFDEPTSGLDASIQATVLHLIKKLQHDHQFSYIFISHDAEVVDFMCSRLATLADGEYREDGQHRLERT